MLRVVFDRLRKALGRFKGPFKSLGFFWGEVRGLHRFGV